MRLGFDLDGIFADFCGGMRREIHRETGILVPESALTHWNWPGDYLTEEELGRVWNRIHHSEVFWQMLDPYPEARAALRELSQARLSGEEIYFLTDRKGIEAKYQTEQWLIRNEMDCPTVILTGDKAGAAQFLGLDSYLDDKPENVEAVRAVGIRAELVKRPWNQSAWERLGGKDLKEAA